MASQALLDRVEAAAAKLDEEYEILYTLTSQLTDAPNADSVALTLSQAKRTQRATQALVRSLAALRDVGS